MKWCALLGLILFLGVAVAPSINADVREQDVTEPIIVEDRQYQRLKELAFTIIDPYSTTTEIEDCGCEDDQLMEHDFPILCRLLYPLFIISLILEKRFHIYLPYSGMNWIGMNLNCVWWTYLQEDYW